MKLFFDANILRINNQNTIIYYSSFLHYALRVNENMAQLIDFIIQNASGNEINMNSLCAHLSGASVEDLQRAVSELGESGLFFSNSVRFTTSDFSSRLQSGKKFYIEKAYLHLTYHCNLNCSYCYNKDKLNKTQDMDIQEWKDVLRVLEEHETKTIIFTGGEPTLYKGVDEIIGFSKERGFKTEILTNGTMLEQIPLNVLRDMDNLLISLDNLPEDSTERIGSDIYHVFNNIIDLSKKGVNITVRSVLTRHNEKEVIRLRDKLQSLEIKHIYSLFIPNSLEELDLVPDLSDEAAIMNGVANDYQYSLVDLTQCGAAFSELAISPNGKIYPCQSLMYDDFLLGDIHSEKWLAEVKNSTITSYFKNRSVQTIPICSSCKLRTICGGGCRAIAYKVYGDLEHRLDYLCDFFERQCTYCIKHMDFA